jgi:glycosyltransferase involved in cell wall biosynthesis
LAQRILELLADRGRRVELGRAARRQVVERYSAEAMVGQIERLYDRLLAGRRIV